MTDVKHDHYPGWYGVVRGRHPRCYECGEPICNEVFGSKRKFYCRLEKDHDEDHFNSYVRKKDL